MAGFFVQLIKRVSEKEDVFTECLAAALRDDPALARRFVLKLCRNNALEVDARVAAIDIATQCRFPAVAGVPHRVHDREYVQAAVSLRALLQDASDATVMKKRLAEFVAAVFRVAS